MSHIIVDDQQAKLIREASENIEIRDQHGMRLGYVARHFTEEDISVAKQRLASNEPRRSTQEVLERLQSLQQD